MIISAGLFIPVAIFSVIGLIALVVKNQKENDRFISELQFFLKHRTIGQNRVKAQLAVLNTRFETLQKRYDTLQNSENIVSSSSSFEGPLAQTEFVEVQASKMEMLELEISSIREALNGNIKDQISNYMKEVDGISERLGKAKDDFRASQNKATLSKMDTKNIF